MLRSYRALAFALAFASCYGKRSTRVAALDLSSLESQPPRVQSAPYDPCPHDGSACKVMALGDSITFGAGSTSGGGYRAPLFARARASAKNITFVGSQVAGPLTIDGVAFPRAHEGYSGYMIADIDGRLGITERTALAIVTYTPRIITLMIGTNDIFFGADLDHAPARFGALLDLIHAKDPTLLVIAANIPPQADPRKNSLATTYNNGIAAEIATRQNQGMHLLLVDMYTPLAENGGYAPALMHDDVHPNDTGYARMADVWFEHGLAAILP